MMARVWVAGRLVVCAAVFGLTACSMGVSVRPGTRENPPPPPETSDQGQDSRRDTPAAERTPGPLGAEAKAGFIRFTWPRYKDWHTDLKSAAFDRNTARWRWRVVLSDTGEFAGEEREFLVPSVSDCRHFEAFPEGGGAWTPDPDPVEECHVFGVPDGTPLHGKVGLVHLAADGSIDRYGPMSAIASARMNARLEPAAFEGPTPRTAQRSLDETRLLFEALVGGSLNRGDNAVDYAGVDFDSYAEAGSWWRGMRARMDALLRGPAATYAGSDRVGFLFRAPNGDSRAWLDATADPKTSTVFWLLQGGRLPQPQRRWAAVGAGASPGMLDCWQSFDHALGLPAGRARNYVVSLTQDLGALDGISQPIVMYQSLYAAAHKVVWDDDVLRAFGLHVPIGRGYIPALDVLCTADIYDPEAGRRVETPEYRVARALQANPGVERYFGETLLSGESKFADNLVGLSKLGDIQALDLYLDDTGPRGYSAARAKAAPSTRIDVSRYVRAGRADLSGARSSFRLIMRVNPGTCAFVREGKDAEERCTRALTVARDLVHTWGRKVIPCLVNQAMWRGFDAGELAQFMREAG